MSTARSGQRSFPVSLNGSFNDVITKRHDVMNSPMGGSIADSFGGPFGGALGRSMSPVPPLNQSGPGTLSPENQKSFVDGLGVAPVGLAGNLQHLLVAN